MIDKQVKFLTASQDGDIETIKSLIDEIDINYQDARGQTALHFSAMRRHYDIASLLVSKGCNLNLKNVYDKTPLMAAASVGMNEIVNLLINEGANLDFQDVRGHTALNSAAYYSLDGVAELLIKGHANVEIQSKNSYTPLITALWSNSYTIADMLIETGLDIQDDCGDTALVKLCCDNIFKKEILDLILKLAHKGADFNIENDSGESALSILKARERLPDELKSLVEKLTLEQLIEEDDTRKSL